MNSKNQEPNNATGRRVPPSPTENSEGRERELARRLAEEEHIQEDFAVLLVHNWQKVAGFAVVLLLFLWIVNEFREAQEAKRGKASALFERVQTSYAEVYGPEDTEKDKAKGKDLASEKTPAKEVRPDGELERQKTIFKENVEALRKDGEHKNYDSLGNLYDAVSLLAENKPEEALKILAKFDISLFTKENADKKASDDKPSDTLIAEFATLLTAKAKIAAGEPFSAVTPLLSNLAKFGAVLNTEALLTVIHLAADNEQKAAAVKLAEEIKALHPEFIDIIDKDLASSGLKSS